MTVEELRKIKNELMKEKKYICISHDNSGIICEKYKETDITYFNELGTAYARDYIQNKMEEIMQFLVHNNIDFEAITLFNNAYFWALEGYDKEIYGKDQLYTNNITSPKILRNILPFSLFYKELENYNIQNSSNEEYDFLNGNTFTLKGCMYAEFDKFIQYMLDDGYELIYVNPIINFSIKVCKNDNWDKYLKMITYGYHIAIRATFPEEEQEIIRKRKNN